MALDPLSILTQILGFGFKAKSALEQAGHNAEDCRRIGALWAGWTPSPSTCGPELVARCEDRSFLRRAWGAKDIADKLRGLCLDVLLNLSAVLLATGVRTASMVAEIKEAVGQLRADFAYTNSMFARILQIVAAHPDVHLRKEVCMYCIICFSSSACHSMCMCMSR